VIQLIPEVPGLRSLQEILWVPAQCPVVQLDQASRPIQLGQVALEAPLVRSAHFALMVPKILTIPAGQEAHWDPMGHWDRQDREVLEYPKVRLVLAPRQHRYLRTGLWVLETLWDPLGPEFLMYHPHLEDQWAHCRLQVLAGRIDPVVLGFLMVLVHLEVLKDQSSQSHRARQMVRVCQRVLMVRAVPRVP